MKPDLESIKAHLNALFCDIREHDDGLIEIAYTPHNTPAVNKASFFPLDEIEEAASFAHEKNSQQGVNVYVGAALRKPETPPFGRSNINDFYASSFVWCDIDDAEAAASAKVRYKKLPPSFIVVTGRSPNLRMQAWWRLAVEEQNTEKLKYNLGFACQALYGDPAVVDPARVMRIAGSVAWPKKTGRVAELTEFRTPQTPTKLVVNELFQKYFNIPQDAPPQATTANSNFKNPFTGNFEIERLLEESRKEGKWHTSMRDAVASMIGKGWSDEQIRIATNPYRRDNSLKTDMVGPLIQSARVKFERPEVIESETIDPETGEVKQRKMHLVSGDNIEFSLDTNDFVKDVFTTQSLSVVYGESNCGKTFFITDLCFSVSENKEWRDKRVEGGATIYVPLEGVKGLAGRVQAYKNDKGTDLKNFHIMPSSFDFLDEGEDTYEFIELIREQKEKIGDIKIVVIDTLARAVGGGDENSGQDMGLLVRHADAIRNETGAHVCFVHHSGKDKAKGARGHSSLRAAVDTEIEISRDEGADYSTIKFVKQRDMEMIAPLHFKLKRVVLGENKYGEEVSSCVVEPFEAAVSQKNVRLTDIQNFLYESIVRAVDDYGVLKNFEFGQVKCITYDEFNSVLENKGYKEMMESENKTTAQQIKSATQSARIALQRHNKISFNKSYIWLID